MSREAWRRWRPRVLPADWYPMEDCASGMGKAYKSADGLLVLASVRQELDGRLWAHVSVSRRERLPSWDDLKLVKDLFVGRDRPAYQVLPRARDYVNVHPYVLHLWTPADDGPDPTPRFEADPERGGQI